MNKIYVLVPLAAFALFIGVQQWSQGGRDARDQARIAAAKAAQAAKNAAEIQAREAAIAEALRLQAQQKKERQEREAREAAEAARRQALLDARDASANERQRLARHIDGLKRDIATEQEAVDRLQIDRDAALAEQAYLKEFVPKARATAAELERVLKHIAAAEAERAKKAAEPAKKKL
jgi:hypothetical protein